MAKYNAVFFDYVDEGALRSARVLVPILYSHLKPGSVLDVGCGRGGWLRIWRDAGCPAIQGIDGDYVDRNRLHIGSEEFRPANLSDGFALGRRFDVVQCLEVAEHVRRDCAGRLIDSIVAHGDVVLFSAAQPGQGGTQHINERPLEYWRDLFAVRGYRAYDCIRPLLRSETSVEPWYRYNPVLYANERGQRGLPASFTGTAVAERAKFENSAPLAWRLRCAVFRYMPVPVVDFVASINAWLTRWVRGAQRAKGNG